MREKLAEKWKRFTYPVVSKIPRLSRPWRVVRNLVCIVLAVFLIWLFLGGRALTAEWAFRRMETRAMVGPSEILLEQREGDEVIFTGRTEYGYFIGELAKYANPLGGWYTRGSVYVERQEDFTFSVAKPVFGGIGASYVDLLLFCDNPAVSRGEADITIAETGELNGRPYDYDKTYTVEFLPAVEGVLAGRVEAETEKAETDDNYWNNLLEQAMLYNFYHSRITATPVTIRLYDDSGGLLLQKSIEYRYPAYY